MVAALGYDLVFPLNKGLALVLLGLSTPHLLYLFTWTNAGGFTRIAKTMGVEAFTLFYKVCSGCREDVAVYVAVHICCWCCSRSEGPVLSPFLSSLPSSS